MLVTHGMPVCYPPCIACASHPNNLGVLLKKKKDCNKTDTDSDKESKLVAPSWERDAGRGKLGKGDEEAQSAIKQTSFLITQKYILQL